MCHANVENEPTCSKSAIDLPDLELKDLVIVEATSCDKKTDLMKHDKATQTRFLEGFLTQFVPFGFTKTPQSIFISRDCDEATLTESSQESLTNDVECLDIFYKNDPIPELELSMVQVFYELVPYVENHAEILIFLVNSVVKGNNGNFC